MLRKSLLILLICMAFGIKAENKTLIITESGLPYTSQTWITTGSDPFPGELINKNWDEGRRITSVAYTRDGWFVIMDKDTGIGMQTYNTDASWPRNWISENWDDGYRITSITKSSSYWCVVMSKGFGYTAQTYKQGSWDELKKWIKETWDLGYDITDAAYNGKNWTIVMSKGTPYSTQGYLWAKSYSELKTKIKERVWDKDRSLISIDSDGSEYFVVYGKYKDGHTPGQSYIENPSNVSKFISDEWGKSRSISHVGGGYPAKKFSSTPTKNISGPGKRTGTFYYTNDKYQQGTFVFYYHNGDYLAQAPGLQNTYNYITRYLMVSESGNEYLFKQAKMNLNGAREILDYAPTMRVSKDWKRIVCQKANILDGSDIIYTKEISKSDYDEISRNKQKYLNRIGIGGGGYNPSHNHDDGNKGGSSQKKCSECGGSGICQSCHGTGGSWEDTGYYIGKDVKSWIPCPSCNGSKKCFMCR